jgi:NADPH-dependent curcumin reductase CurA
VLELLPKYEAEFYQVVPKAVRDGQIKHREHMYRGLEHTGQALIDVLTGKNDGKSVIIVADS